MSAEIRRVAMVSMHTSPTAQAGTADAGGMNIAILSTALELAAQGIEVDLLTRAVGAPVIEEVREGVTLHTLEAGPRGVLPKHRLPEFADEFGEAVATFADRRAPRYDIIHAHYWLSGLATLPVALELGIPFVQSFHTLAAMKNRAVLADEHMLRSQNSTQQEPEARVRGEMFLSNQADAVIAGSSAEVASLIDDSRAPADRVWVIPPGVDTTLFSPDRVTAAPSIRERLGVNRNRKIAVVVGRMQPMKGQDLAIRILAELVADSADAPLLVLAGEPTPGEEGYREMLYSLAAEMGVDQHIRFVGALGRFELAELLATAAVTVVPSHSETFGLVALESAASGTPAIGSRSTGLADAIADGESGVLVNSRDPREWARAIASLLGDEGRLAAISASARVHAERFTWRAAAASMLGVYAGIRR